MILFPAVGLGRRLNHADRLDRKRFLRTVILEGSKTPRTNDLIAVTWKGVIWGEGFSRLNGLAIVL